MSEVWRPAKGHGEGQRRTTPYRAPNNKSSNVIYIGNDYWISRPKQGKTEFKGVQLVHPTFRKSSFGYLRGFPGADHRP